MTKESIKNSLFRERNIVEELKKLNLRKIMVYFWLILSFFTIYIFSNRLGEFYSSSDLFNIFWILLLILVISIIKHKRIIYLVSYYYFFICSLVQYFYIGIMQKPFGFSQLLYFKEGMTYINSIISNIDTTVLMYLIFGIINSIIGVILIRKYQHNQIYTKKKIVLKFILLILLIIGRCIYISNLSNEKISNTFYSGFSEKEIYNKFTDKQKAFYMTGIFEYSVREPYLYIKKSISFDIRESKKTVNEYFNNKEQSSKENDYTGIFKDKNVIFIMAESVDNWLIDEDTMPTVYNMQKNSINFINRYAPSYGSGQTLNTEYCLNTGLYIPIDYNIYSTIDNNYKYSLANMFKKTGYYTSTMHFNEGAFYNRNNMHKAYGYDDTHFLLDMTGVLYYNDAKIINNEKFYNLMVSKENKFLTFFTTYSTHLPYNSSNELCKDTTTEDECIKKLARYTDDAIKILIEKLERDNLLDDTVIVFVTDHYAYGYSEDKLEQIKGGSTNIYLDKVPFFIWNNNNYVETIDKYVDTQDILPTILNLFGIEFGNTYIGTDVFSENHNNYVYFNDNSYIGDIANISIKDIENEKNINYLIIKTDYYK